MNYILPLEKTYVRKFQQLAYSGFEMFTRSDLKKRRAQLFFDVFLEDCRHKHQFEGYLIEPFFVEEVDYLICLIPLGLAGNSLKLLFCKKIQIKLKKTLSLRNH